MNVNRKHGSSRSTKPCRVSRSHSRYRESFCDLSKHAPLLIPVDPADNAPQVSFVETLDARQEKNLLLDVRSEMQQLHDLCHAGSRHPAETGQFRIVANRFI